MKKCEQLAFDEDGEPMPNEREAISVARALIKNYKPTNDPKSDFDKGMRAIQMLTKRVPRNKEIHEKEA